MRSSMKITPPLPVSVHYRESEKEEMGNSASARPALQHRDRHTFYSFIVAQNKRITGVLQGLGCSMPASLQNGTL